MPPTIKEKQQSKNEFKLYAANNSCIDTYGSKTITLNLGLRRPFTWVFVVANVTKPILGADFLKHFGLLVDIQNKKIIDNTTKLFKNCMSIESPIITIKTVKCNDPYTDVLNDFPSLTAPFSKIIDAEHDVRHYIETTGQPVTARPRRLPPDKLVAAKKEFRQMVEQGICRTSSSPWASPIHMIKKNNDEWRVCGDYRALNAKTVPDNYPVPHIHDVAYMLQGKKCFSKLDLQKAYYQIPIAESDIVKTAVITPFGLFEFLRTPFGLRNAAQTFQRFIHNVLYGLDFCFPYIDDILIASETKEVHETHLRSVFTRLQKHGLILNLNKCMLGVEEIDFLGYHINSKGTTPLQEKVNTIVNYKKPETVKALRRFLGMLNFYRHFLKKASEYNHLCFNIKMVTGKMTIQ